MISRRVVLAGLTGAALSNGLLRVAQGAPTPVGSINAVEYGLVPGSPSDQTTKFKALLESASDKGSQIFLPPGTYIVSAVECPSYVNIIGISGQSRILYGGKSSFIQANDAEHIQFNGLIFDGDAKKLAEAKGLIETNNVSTLAIRDCEIVGSAKNGLHLYQTGGEIDSNRISNSADAAIFAANSTGLKITGNSIAECGMVGFWFIATTKRGTVQSSTAIVCKGSGPILAEPAKTAMASTSIRRTMSSSPTMLSATAPSPPSAPTVPATFRS